MNDSGNALRLYKKSGLFRRRSSFEQIRVRKGSTRLRRTCSKTWSSIERQQYKLGNIQFENCCIFLGKNKLHDISRWLKASWFWKFWNRLVYRVFDVRSGNWLHISLTLPNSPAISSAIPFALFLSLSAALILIAFDSSVFPPLFPFSFCF